MIKAARQSMLQIGSELLAKKKADLLAASGDKNHSDNESTGRDLLTLLIKANLATDVPESQRLSDEEVIARKSGHPT